MSDITAALRQVVSVANQIASGDLTVRVPSTSRRDEIGLLAQAFDRMVTIWREMVHVAQGEVEKSGIQVNSSVTKIAATAKQQQVAASEIAATTMEIGATSREISARSQATGRHHERSRDGRRAVGRAGGPGAERPHPHGRDHASRHGRGRLHQCQAGGAQREGRQHRSGRDHDHESRRSDEPPVAQRGHRGGKGGRIRARLCGRRDRDPAAGRPDGGVDLRHRTDGQGDPVGRGGRA